MSQMPDRLDRFDSSLEEVKRENQWNRRALDHILQEIIAREEETPRQRLATDLLNILTANLELVQGGVQGATWKDLPEMAEKCLEAAGKIYPEPAGQNEEFLAEIFRQHAVMEGVIERLDTDVEARRARWGGLDKVPINPGGHFMSLGAIGRDPEGYFQSGPTVADQAPDERFAHLRGYPPGDVAVPGPRCGAVHGAHVCARHAGHAGSHASESGLVGWNEEPEFPALGRELHEHGRRVAEGRDDEPRDSGAHPGVMLDREGARPLKKFDLPYRVVLEGKLFVEAASADQAEALAEAGSWNDDTFYNRAEITDWKVLGKAKEVE